MAQQIFPNGRPMSYKQRRELTGSNLFVWQNSKIPDEWIDEFMMPIEREWAVMIDPERRLFDIKLTQYEGVRQGWEHSRLSM